ncbi:MAG: hypothetical protein JNM07_13110 [Phycisphaerae bacterium]|nr:hypothetical protein [Phycisphaerae bacterium]
MKKRIALMLAAGTTACLATAANAQFVINETGATLLENYLKSNAATNDYWDVDGDGVARKFGTNDQLAPYTYDTIGYGAPISGAGGRWWALNLRLVGSVNGYQELVDYGTTFLTTADNVDLKSNRASKAFHNRRQYVTNQTITDAIGNSQNPGGLPICSNTTTLHATFTADEVFSGGGVRIDFAAVDVPSRWAVRNGANVDADPTDVPGTAGYGTNPRRSVNKQGTSAGADLDNLLANLGARNLNTGNPDANTIFDTLICYAPIAPLTNLGTGYNRIDASDFRQLLSTGRNFKGENLMVVTRDSGSGTRNGFTNSLCLDPSWGVGENVGPLSALPEQNILGPDLIPSNKNGNAEVESVVRNHRLAVGYAGAERGVNSGWLINGQIEILSIRNDLQGGTLHVRPNIDALLLNSTADSFRLGGPSILATIGDPLAASVAKGGNANGNPQVRNEEAAAFINNTTRSVAAFISVPGGSNTLFTPGEFLATQFSLLAAFDSLPAFTDPCNWSANAGKNAALQTYLLNNSVLRDAGYYNFGVYTLNGKIPTRKLNTAYSDGVSGASNFYIRYDGSNLTYGQNLNSRNRISGDFNGDALRNWNDSSELVKAFRWRYDSAAWTPANGTGAIAGAPGTEISPEIIGDFNGDGNFNLEDLRYWADGLALDPATGTLDRKRGFTRLDDAYRTQTGNPNANLFVTTLATGVPYKSGDTRGDVAGAAGTARGFAPVGFDGRVDAKDIDYVSKQFKQNPRVTDGRADWSDTSEASTTDLSADINGDLGVDQKDVCELVTVILGTSFGDLNLDGTVSAAELITISNNIGNPGGWAQGDMDGDGQVTTADLAIASGCVNICCPADVNFDGSVDDFDFFDFLNDFNNNGCRGDFNGDGSIDDFDFFDFLNAFNGGAC